MFLAVSLLLALTPLEFITLDPLNSIAMHIPIITGFIVLGPEIGNVLGGTFGIISLIKNTIAPTPLSFVFSPFIPVIGTDHGSWKTLLIAFIPRILIGIIPYFAYKRSDKLTKEKAQPVPLFTVDVLGSATNTIPVMNIIYFSPNPAYAEVTGKAGTTVYLAIIATISSSGVPEALVAGVTASAVASVLLRLMKWNTT